MPKDELQFGTDGWRDVIADRFTFDNLARAAQGYADHMKDASARFVLVGHDTRFLGPEFAALVADVLGANGLRVALSTSYLPTPALSLATCEYGADGGVMLTASHNPARYQGSKLKGGYGGSATDATYRSVAGRVASTGPGDVRWGGPEPEAFDVREDYYDALDRLLDLSLPTSRAGLVVHDAMGGAAAGWLRDYAERRGFRIQVAEFRSHPDPLFYGVNPEPIEQNLQAAREVAWEHGPLFVSATDGDGDRLGVVLPDGSFFNSHQIFAVLLQHLHGRGLGGRVVKTFTVSRVIERLAARLGLSVTETPVGFKHIVQAMLEGDVLIGGEESGGIGVHGHIPERDGILNTLLLLEAVLASGKGLAELFRGAEELAGITHAYDRVDLQLGDMALKDRLMAALEGPRTEFAGHGVLSIERLDGVKLNFTDGSWLLFRASGTEPVLRIYCEAATAEQVGRLLDAAVAFTRGQ